MANGKKFQAKSMDFPQGGKTKMFGPQTVGKQAPSGTATKGSGGNDTYKVSGGSGKMFGFTPSQSAKAGQTGAR